MPGRILIGTASWTDHDPFYPKGVAGAERLARVRERHPDDKGAIEFRHRSWGEPETWERVTDLLSEAKLTYCCVDEPQIGSGTMTPVVAATTPELAMIRLHGRNAHTWYKRVEKTGQRFDWWYTEDELDEIAKTVRDLAEAAADVHVSVNTNGYNQGPVNALKLAGILDLPQANPRLLVEVEGAARAPQAVLGT